MRLLLILPLALLVACGPAARQDIPTDPQPSATPLPTLPPQSVDWPPAAAPMVTTYVQVAAQHDTEVSQVKLDKLDVDEVEPGSLGEHVIGVCEAWTNGVGKIKLDRRVWKSEDTKAKQALLFHELGHCLHKMKHRGAVDDEGYFTSLMYEYVPTGWMYETKYKQYNREMFGGSFR